MVEVIVNLETYIRNFERRNITLHLEIGFQIKYYLGSGKPERNRADCLLIKCPGIPNLFYYKQYHRQKDSRQYGGGAL